MARQSGYPNQESGWRDLAWAAAAAALVTLVLVIGVALAWLVGSGPSTAPAITSAGPVTPTPRAISFARSTPIPPPPPTEPAPTALASVARAEATTASSKSENTKETFEAANGDDFAALASAPWTVSGDALVNDGANAIAQRWLTLTPSPSSSVVIEAEIRVRNVLSSVCDQSFGIAAGSPGAGLIFGGGVIFPCSGGGAEARLSNVTQWESGYNGAPVIAESAFDPGDEWHTYRFELRGKKLRLIVDGKGLISGEVDPSIDAAASDVEAGLWSQGVGIEVRRVTVTPLSR